MNWVFFADVVMETKQPGQQYMSSEAGTQIQGGFFF